MYFTRLTPNSNNWTHPSGPAEKCTSAELFEFQHGFGFEEWLRNPNHQNDGYQYGFIHAFLSPSRIGQDFENVCLWTRWNFGPRQQWFLVGRISSLRCLSSAEVNQFLSEEKVEGMVESVENLGLNPEIIWEKYREDSRNLLNVRFNLEDITLLVDDLGRPLPQFEFNQRQGKGRFGLYANLNDHHSAYTLAQQI